VLAAKWQPLINRKKVVLKNDYIHHVVYIYHAEPGAAETRKQWATELRSISRRASTNGWVREKLRNYAKEIENV